MKIGELINILKSYNQDYEFMISSDNDLWSLDQHSFREATLYETSQDVLVDAIEYEPADGNVVATKEVLIIDLDV